MNARLRGIGMVAALMLGAIAAVTAPGLVSPAAAAASTSKVISPNAKALKLSFTVPGKGARVSFSGLKDQVVRVTDSAGDFADNCDVMLSLVKGSTTIVAPLCAGQAGT